MALFSLLLAGGLFSRGYVAVDFWRAFAWGLAALLGIWCAALWAAGEWQPTRRRPGFWLALLFAWLLLWTGLQQLPLPSGLTLFVSGTWRTVAGYWESLGEPVPDMLPLATAPWKARHGWDQLLATACVSLAACCLARHGRGRRFLLGAVAVLALLEGWNAALDLVIGREGARARGFLFNPNHSAAVISMGLPIAFVAWSRMRRRRTDHHHLHGHGARHDTNWDGVQAADRSGLLGFVLGIAALGWLATLSRASFALAIGVGLAALLARARSSDGDVDQAGEHPLMRRAGSSALAVAVLTLAVLAVPLLDALGLRYGAAPDALEGGRFAAWAAALRGLAEAPLAGLGLGGAEFAMQRFMLGAALRTTPIWCHNDYLQLLVELGIPATLVTVGLTLAVLRTLTNSRRMAKLQRLATDERPYDAAVLFGLAMIAGHSAVDFPVRIPLAGFQAVMLLPLAWSAHVSAAHRIPVVRHRRPAAPAS
jgi:O-antigen ligase